MNTISHQFMVERSKIYEMLTKEDNYAHGWGQGKKAVNPAFPDHAVNAATGEPFSMMDWVSFARKYIDEAELVFANYTPDARAVRIRLLKAASLLVTALQVHGTEKDLEDIAGVSSSKYPILSGGLKTMQDMGGRQEV